LTECFFQIPKRLNQSPIKAPIKNGESQKDQKGEINPQGRERFWKKKNSDDPEADEDGNEKAGDKSQWDFPILFHALIDFS
jgi:hypothetical protein